MVMQISGLIRVFSAPDETSSRLDSPPRELIGPVVRLDRRATSSWPARVAAVLFNRLQR